MKMSCIRIPMLVFVSLWFGVVLPGHERGAVRVAGAIGDSLSSDSFSNSDTVVTDEANAGHLGGACGKCVDDSQDSQSRPCEKLPCDQPGEQCAVCHHLTTLGSPVVFCFDILQIEVVGITQWASPASPHFVGQVVLPSRRGPPVAA